jgi:thioredoxin reductase (NADPH)
MDHTELITSDHLRGLDVFRGLSEPALQRLLGAGTVCHMSPQERLASQFSGVARHYYFLLRGVVAIALVPDEPRLLAPATVSKRPPKQQRFLGYFEAGACFSDAYLQQQHETRPSRLACVAANAVSLLQLEETHLGDLLTSEPRWRSQLVESVASARELFLTRQDPTGRVVQDFFLRENYVTSSVVRVGRLDRCLDCNKCRDACAERHGKARMARFGPSLGRLTFPIVCRTCHDQPCISVCSFGGIALDPESGDVHISDRCAGCGACAKRCPNDAISMIWRPYTVADFPDPMPLSDATGMTNVSNMLVAGDVSGAALIRIAMNEAVRAVDRIVPSGLPHVDPVVEVAIIGAGPAGLAAAMRCRERGLSYCVFERDRLASTIRDYPKNKHVMAEPSNVELLSSLWFGDCSKEELLDRWQKTVKDEQLRVLEQTEVKQVKENDGLFTLDTDRGQYVAEHVLVCIGKRGAPRRLELAGESYPRVRYVLDDPDELANQQVLVVGGGDSALEAALALADVTGTEVTLSYRRGSFTRAKVQNRKRLESYQAAGRIRVELKSTAVALEPHVVRLMTEAGEIAIPNDVVFAFLGADPPTEFLRDAGIQVLQPGSPEMAEFAALRGQRQRATKCDHCAGYPDRACLSACPTGALIEVQTDQLFLDVEADPLTRIRRFSDAPFLRGVSGKQARLKTWITVCTLLILAGIGLESFLIRTQPEVSLLGRYVEATGSRFAVSFTSGRGIGHWLGYVGAGMMLASFLYSLRTRVNYFKPWGSQTGWLSAHVWLGFTGATLVTYHSVLKLDRWAGIACVLMWIVIATGAVGRFLFGRVRSAVGLAQFELDALRGKCRALAEQFPDSGAVRTLIGDDSSDNRWRWILGTLLWEELRDRVALFWLWAFGTGHLQNGRERQAVLGCFSQWATYRRRSHYYQSLDLILRHWNLVHIVLAIAMAILAGTHIVYGFRYKAV